MSTTTTETARGDDRRRGRQRRDADTAMVTALVRLRGALQDARLPLELPGVEEQRARAPRWSTSSRTTSSRG